MTRHFNEPLWQQVRKERLRRKGLIKGEIEVSEGKPLPIIEFHQHDWVPAFAAFLPDATTAEPESRAFCVVNLASFLGVVAQGDMPREELPYFLAETMMHEIIHVLEQWAGVEFSEERVEALLQAYAAKAAEVQASTEGSK